MFDNIGNNIENLRLQECFLKNRRKFCKQAHAIVKNCSKTVSHISLDFQKLETSISENTSQWVLPTVKIMHTQ